MAEYFIPDLPSTVIYFTGEWFWNIFVNQKRFQYITDSTFDDKFVVEKHSTRTTGFEGGKIFDREEEEEEEEEETDFRLFS